MDKISSYRIIPELKLIIEVFGGKISITDAIELKRKEVCDKNYNPNFNYIVSISEVEVDDKLKYDFSKYIDTIKNDNKIMGIRKSAPITKTPNQVVASTLYEHALQELPMNFKIFSSIEAALKWIDLSVNYASTVDENIKSLMKNAI